MRYISTVLAACLFVALLLPAGRAAAQADCVSTPALECLSPIDIDLEEGTGMVAAGTGLYDAGEGTININVPTGATVKQVLLYWEGRTVNSSGDDEITVGGNNVTGTLIGTSSHTRPRNDDLNSFAYRKDITHLGLVSDGPNSIAIADVDFGGPNGFGDGAALVVIFEEVTRPLMNFEFRDGNDFAFLRAGNDTQRETVPQTFTFDGESFERTFELWLLVGDAEGQQSDRPDRIDVTVGGTTQSYNLLDGSDGAQWDTEKILVNIPAGATSLTVQLISGPENGRSPESLVWVFAGLAMPTTPTGEGCTYTQGFWKTHPNAWPQGTSHDDAFFQTGQTWLQVLNTAPKKGNAYYILAHQYIAAYLNIQNGADPAAVASELTEAQGLLAFYDGDPEPMDGLKAGRGADPVRQRFIELAEKLDKYNNGEIGPGHCDENDGQTSDNAEEKPEKAGKLKVQARPTPFNPSTMISFELESSTEVSLIVYDMLGRPVRVLAEGTFEAGTHSALFEAGSLPSGTYLYRLVTPQGVAVGKMVLLK